MEKEIKRKRSHEKEGEEGTQRRKTRGKEEASEEEVEEFFAILRRMRVAVKYFEKGGGEGWRAAVEAEGMLMAEEDKESETRKAGDAAEEDGVLDLNKVPEEKG